MENSQAIQQIVEFCEASFRDIFQDQGCAVQRTSAPPEAVQTDQYVTIDMQAEGVQVSLLLAVPEGLLRASYPMRGQLDNACETVLADWYNELANRLIGSLKNKIVVTIPDLIMGLPVMLKSSEKIEVISPDSAIEVLVFEHGAHACSCSLMISLQREIGSFEEVEAEVMDGELEFF